MKKKISIILISVITLYSLYIGLNMYQTKQMEIIPFEELNQVEVSTKDELQNGTQITGTAMLDSFEAVALIDQMVLEDTLYIIIYKWSAIIQDTKIDFTLENTEQLDQVNRISVVYGEIFSGEGSSRGISLNDLITHPDQQVIWVREGGVTP